jgi:hypothetical protein
MAGPPNIRGVGAEFTAEGFSSAKPNTSLSAHNTTSSNTTSGRRRKFGQPKRRQERRQTGFEVAQRTLCYMVWGGNTEL